MQELTMYQMSEMDGTGWRSFFEGFLCGAGILASIAVVASPEPVTRFSIWATTLGVCGLAFFG